MYTVFIVTSKLSHKQQSTSVVYSTLSDVRMASSNLEAVALLSSGTAAMSAVCSASAICWHGSPQSKVDIVNPTQLVWGMARAARVFLTVNSEGAFAVMGGMI